MRVEVLASSSSCWSGRCGSQPCIKILVRTNPYYTRVPSSQGTSHAPLRVGLYCRVSHDPTGRGTSVADQEKEGRAWCAANGHLVAWLIVDNDISASRYSKKERPGFTEVQRRLAGADPVEILWAWESSRFTRDLKVYAQVRALCERYEVLWSYHGKTYDMSRADDRFSTALDVILGERASDDTSDRVQRAVDARVEAGTAHGRVPYGYRAVYHPHTGAPIGREPDPGTAPVVKEIVRRVLGEEPSYQIAKDLNRRGVISPHGFRLQRTGKSVNDARPWTISLVRQLAENPTYAALRTYEGAVKGEATWEPIISVAEHRRVVARFSDPARKNTRDREVKHLLAGIVLCGVCGDPCRRVVNHGSPSYSCRTNHCVSRVQSAVDGLVTETLLLWLERPNAAQVFTNRDDSAEVDAAVAELAELQARLAEFERSADQPGGISAASLARREAHYLPLIEDARRRAIPTHVPEVIRDLVEAEDVRERWADLTPLVQRSVVRHLMTVRIMRTSSRGSHGFDPSCVNIEWL